MLPNLVLLLGIAFMWWLFRMDMGWRRLPSRGLWLAGVCLALVSSRSPAYWYGALLGGGGASSNLEGSPVNVIFNGTLFLATIITLNRRGFRWRQFAGANKALFAIFAFFLCGALWSPFPFPTVKRLVQEFGCCVLIPLIILTEQDPGASLRVVVARVSYVLFPLSVVLIRFFPRIGRVISEVSGFQMASGVADHKNSLGQLAMVFCLVLLWDLKETRSSPVAPQTKSQRWARLLNLGIGLYLLYVSESATSLMCFLLGLGLFFASNRLARMRNARRVFVASVLAFLCLLSLEHTYGITSQFSEAMGRGAGMSGRTLIWETVLEKNTHHLIGAGFRGFWESPDGESVWKELQMNRMFSTHNGYLEIYVQGGLVAVFLLFAFVFSTGLNAADKLVKGDPLGRLAVLFWPILLIYNVTESAFLQVGVLWFTMLLVTIENPWGMRLAR